MRTLALLTAPLLALALALPAGADGPSETTPKKPAPLPPSGAIPAPTDGAKGVVLDAAIVDLVPVRERVRVTVTLRLRSTRDAAVGVGLKLPSDLDARELRLRVGEGDAAAVPAGEAPRVEVPAGDKLRVELTYSATTALSEETHGLPADLHARLGDRRTRVALAGGAGWSGMIGEVRVRIFHGPRPAGVPWDAIKPEPAGDWKVSQRQPFLLTRRYALPREGEDPTLSFEAVDVGQQIAALEPLCLASKLREPAAQFRLLFLMGRTGAPNQRKRNCIMACLPPRMKDPKPLGRQSAKELRITTLWYGKMVDWFRRGDLKDDLEALLPHYAALQQHAAWKDEMTTGERDGHAKELARARAWLAERRSQ